MGVMSFSDSDGDSPMPAAAHQQQQVPSHAPLVRKATEAELVADSHMKTANMLGELSTVLTRRNSLKPSDTDGSRHRDAAAGGGNSISTSATTATTAAAAAP